MILWIVIGFFWGLYSNRGDGTVEKRLFIRGCQLIATIQIAMTCLLFIGLYNEFSQWVVWSIPWLFGLWDWKTKGVTPVSFNKISWHHAFIGIVGVGYLWHATPPPWMRDSLTYHLALAKQYSLAGNYTDTDFIIFSYFPQGWQSILSALHSPLTGKAMFNPRYLAVGICILTALGLFGWIKEQIDHREWALTGAILYLLTPSIIEFGTSCYVQPWLTAVYLWIMMSIYDRKSPLIIGGIVGIACSLKYSALILPLLILPIVYSSSRRVNDVFHFFLGIFTTGTLFYVRNLLETGNPIFPMMYELFGGEGWDSWRSIAYEHTLDNYGMGRSIIDYVLLPLRLFGTMDMTKSFQGSLGIGWLLMIAISWWQIRKDTVQKWMWGLLVGWFIFWALQVQQVRFFLPIIPLIVLICIPILSRWRDRSWGIWLSISVIWSLYPIQQIVINQQGHVYWKVRQTESIDKATTLFLDHRLPENHPIYTYMNSLTTQKIWLVWMRGYHYYIDAPVRIDNVFGATRFEQLLWKHTTQEIQTSLRRDNISHIIVNWRFFLQDNNADYLEDGASIVIQERFTTLIQMEVLRPIRQWGPVWIYELEESSSEK